MTTISREGPVTGIILAAGTSSRMGRPKQLLPYRGRSLIQHVVDAAAEAELDEVLVVLGHVRAEILSDLTLPPTARTVTNPEYVSGQASSLRAGFASARPDSVAAVILLGDQPDIVPAHIRQVVAAWRACATAVARASYLGTPGHPVVMDRAVWAEVATVTGDSGARGWIARNETRVIDVPLPEAPPLEVDTDADYRMLLADD